MYFMQLIDLYPMIINPFPSFIWNTALGLLRQLEVIEKKAVRNICNCVYKAHTDPLFKHLNIPKLIDIFNTQLCKLTP